MTSLLPLIDLPSSQRSTRDFYSVPGKGSFAAAEGGEQQRRIRELKTQAAPLLEELKTLGCTEEDLLQLWRGGETHA